MVIAIDADGTCFTHEYPNIGKDIGAIPVLKRLVSAGHKLMLWTMRSNKPSEGRNTLKEAVDWFKINDIPLWSINENIEQKVWTDSNKQYANLYIDDSAIGCPLLQEYKTVGEEKIPVGRPFVNWEIVEKGLETQGVLTPKKETNANKTTDIV